MIKISGKLTVYFEDPFWVGVFEHIQEGKLSVCKVTFGAEPKDYEVYDYVLKYFYQLKFSPDIMIQVKEVKQNPKRIQREVHKQVQNRGIGTKSQQALKQQYEENKCERKILRREEKEKEKQRQFEIKQKKKKEKHRGR